MMSKHEQEITELKESKDSTEKELITVHECVSSLRKEVADTTKSYEHKLREASKREEELQLKIVSGESNNKVVDQKLAELSKEKQEAIDAAASKETELRHQLQMVQADLQSKVEDLESKLKAKVKEHLEQVKEIQDEKEKQLEKQSEELTAQYRSKLTEMKKKAESKIAGLRKQINTQAVEKETELSNVQESLNSAENRIKELETKHQEDVDNLKLVNQEELAMKLAEVRQTCEGQAGTQEKELRNQIINLESQNKELSENVQNLVVEKMDALHEQEAALKDEHEAEMENLRKEHTGELEKCEKRFKAKMADKDLEYNSKIKQLLREFQIKYSEKEREQQETVGELIEKGQREEQKIIDEYKTEIIEYQRELKLREDEMVALKNSTAERLEQKGSEIEELQREHTEALQNIEREHHETIQEMVRKNEEDMETLHEEHRAKVEEIHERYKNELESQARDRKSEVAAVEKKFKTQMKKNQNEMKKLLNQKESFIQAQSVVLTEAEPEQLQRTGSSNSLNSVSPGRWNSHSTGTSLMLIQHRRLTA